MALQNLTTAIETTKPLYLNSIYNRIKRDRQQEHQSPQPPPMENHPSIDQYMAIIRLQALQAPQRVRLPTKLLPFLPRLFFENIE